MKFQSRDSEINGGTRGLSHRSKEELSLTFLLTEQFLQ